MSQENTRSEVSLQINRAVRAVTVDNHTTLLDMPQTRYPVR